MPTPNQNSFSLLDMSGGVQTATSHLLKKRMEVKDSYNAAFNIRIGSACRRFGYEQVGQIVQSGNDSLYGGTYNYQVTNNKVICGINNAGGTNATLNFLDSGGVWTPIISNAAPNTRFQCLNYLDELYVAGKAPTGYMTLTNVDYTLTPSTTRNVLNAPKSKFIAQYAGKLYALNCQVSGVTYADRIYVSSAPTGVVTNIQGDQQGQLVGLSIDSVKYLKVGMSVDIYKAGTSTARVTGLVITSVDKVNNTIGFQQTTVNVSNLDEVWISGRWGLLTTLWNTDYPTPQSADWFRLPTGTNESSEITGWTVNTNRLMIFTKNSVYQWDGSNLMTLNQSVGTVSHESIQNIGTWTLWFHTTGVWGYNVTTGQMKMISKAITPTIQRINPVNYKYISAVVANRTYKLSVGQLLNSATPNTIYLQTTSTSTSSTSTSSTSSSTSSTSTSSTSTSTITGTTTSTSTSSTSVSSTSSSISSTSTSSTSSSTSVSSTSTSSTSSSTSTSTSSTTTQPTNKLVTRLCYDFDLNIWWPELHSREIRFQFNHTMNGYTKPYFTDENGYLFRDETGLNDAGNSIPMLLEFGRTNCGTEQEKIFESVLLDSERTRAGIMQYQLDNGNWETLGQITEPIGTLVFSQSEQKKIGHDINLRFTHNTLGDPPFFNGWTVYFNNVQSIVNEVKP